jgi:alcohol dehydrogenase/L-iditol 2-dehydrogenase
MRAALLVEPGRVEVADIPDPELGPGGVRIAVRSVGLCGSDLSVFTGRWNAPAYPWIMGHEAFGVIDAVGDGVPADRVGQTVVVEPNVACERCAPCADGRSSSCLARQSVGMNRPGALAEQLVVPAAYAWPMPDIGPDDLVCVEPTTVALAALRRLASELPDTALVVGVGAQGLLMTMVLQDRGVDVEAYDVNPDRLAFAGSLGARRAEPGHEQEHRLVIDTVGSPESADVAMGRLSPGGTILLIGLDSRPLGFSAQAIVRRQAVIRGSLTYDHPADFAASTEYIAEGGFRPGRIVTDRFSLAEVQAAFERSAGARGKTRIDVADLAQRS